MKIEVRTLMNKNEMLSHIFLGCIERKDLEKIKDKYIGEKDWQKESVKIPVEMKIGGVSVNPKSFFDEWKKQMHDIISEEATKLVSEKIGSGRLSDIQYRLSAVEEIVNWFEKEITWDTKNPFE